MDLNPYDELLQIRNTLQDTLERARAMGDGERPFSRNVALAITSLEEAESRIERALIENEEG